MPALSRREFLRLAGLVAAATALNTACQPAYTQLAGGPPAPTGFTPLPPADLRALQRLTYGPTAVEIARVAEIGLTNWLDEQLNPASINDAPVDWRLRQFDSLTMDANELREWQPHFFDRTPNQIVIRELRQATVLRQVYSRRQVAELLTEFWSDHFNVFIEKGDCWFLKTVEDREVIRPNILGSFRTLVGASAASPAMLIYLDNHVNHRDAPNENYARELIELHTLGVNGGYTQADVMALAQCFTGWTVKEHFWRGQFVFKPEMHTPGDKTILGVTIPESGQAEVEQVLDLLATHPATATYLATKLVRRFIADNPPAELVAHAANAFLQSNGDLTALTRAVLFDGLLARPDLIQPRYKRPANFVASALRQLYAETDAGEPVLDYLARLGQLPFAWPTPDGYPDTGAAWLGNLMPRWQFALALARNELDGTQINLTTLLADSASPTAAADRLTSLLLGAPLPPAQRDSLLTNLSSAGATDSDLPPILTAGLVAAPAFQWR